MKTIRKIFPYCFGAVVAVVFYAVGVFLSGWRVTGDTYSALTFVFGAVAALLGAMTVAYIKTGSFS